MMVAPIELQSASMGKARKSAEDKGGRYGQMEHNLRLYQHNLLRQRMRSPGHGIDYG